MSTLVAFFSIIMVAALDTMSHNRVPDRGLRLLLSAVPPPSPPPAFAFPFSWELFKKDAYPLDFLPCWTQWWMRRECLPAV